MYVVTGATGHTGSVVTEKLLAKGQQVRVLGRSAERLDRFKQMGAAPMVADETNAAALTAAFTGADAAYIMFPSDYSAPDVRAYQRQLSAALASALQKTGVRHAVVLSGYGADQPKGNGPVDGLHNLEQALNAIGSLNALLSSRRIFHGEPLGPNCRNPIVRLSRRAAASRSRAANDRHA